MKIIEDIIVQKVLVIVEYAGDENRPVRLYLGHFSKM